MGSVLTPFLSIGVVASHGHGKLRWREAEDGSLLRRTAVRGDVIVRKSISKSVDVCGVYNSCVVL